MTPTEKRVPRSAFDQTKGLAYFPRMLDKARLLAKNLLREDFVANVGIKLDARMCDFLRVSYEALKDQVLAGKSDEEALQWCFEKGRNLSEFDIYVWTGFLTKFGWNDDATPRLEKMKAENGLGARGDIVTFCQFFEVDEGRAR